MIVKNFNHTLDRLSLFFNGKNYPESEKVGLLNQIYEKEESLIEMKILRNTGRVSIEKILGQLDDFKEDFKLGD
jgi:hypothetical protein